MAVDVEAWQGRVGVKLLYHDFSALFKFCGVLLGPPLLQVSCGIELAALIIEAVGDLVPNRGSPSITIYDSIINIGIRDAWNRKGGGGKDDLVIFRLVVCVVGLRCHIPFGPIHRLAKF